MQLLIKFLLVIYVIVALLMLLIILMQRPRSEGLGAAFGGGLTENIFGAQTTNVLVKITAWLAGIFFALTFTLSILYSHKTAGDSSLRRELMKEQTGKAASASPASPAASIAPTPATNISPSASLAPSPAPAATASPMASSPPARR